MLKQYQEMLEYAFDVFNRVYFNNELPPVVITIQDSKRSYGHYTVYAEWRVENERLHEINVSSSYLNRPLPAVLSTLVHEMVHFYCALHGIKDCSGSGNRYHNKNFKREAEARGLIISQAPYIGWSVTQPSPEFIEVIRSNGIEKPLDINRDGYTGVMVGRGGDDDGNGNTVLGPDGLPIAKKRSSTRKYICPKCGNSFRATKDIRVLCIDCNEQFIKVEK
jgi:DNA-directed RNA polymerase subunit RPC12/RpoP